MITAILGILGLQCKKRRQGVCYYLRSVIHIPAPNRFNACCLLPGSGFRILQAEHCLLDILSPSTWPLPLSGPDPRGQESPPFPFFFRKTPKLYFEEKTCFCTVTHTIPFPKSLRGDVKMYNLRLRPKCCTTSQLCIAFPI